MIFSGTLDHNNLYPVTKEMRSQPSYSSDLSDNAPNNFFREESSDRLLEGTRLEVSSPEYPSLLYSKGQINFYPNIWAMAGCFMENNFELFCTFCIFARLGNGTEERTHTEINIDKRIWANDVSYSTDIYIINYSYHKWSWSCIVRKRKLERCILMKIFVE